MRSKAVEVSSAHPSLPSAPSGADSRRPAAVKVAAEPRHSGTLTARTAGKESGREGRIPGRDEEFRNREPAEQFFRGVLTCSMREEPCPSHQAKIPKLTAGEIEALLRRLNLARTRHIYAEVADRAEKEEWSYRDFLAFLLAEEVAHRQQTRLVRFTRKAHFPFFRTIEEFDFQRQPVLRKSHLGSYLEPDFVREGRSLILYGKHGRGKTHLAVAIGYRAIQNGFETLCANAAELIEGLSNASQRGQLQQALFTYTHPHVLIVDEIGYLAHGQDAANVLFHVVNDRYLKKRPMIFTTNKPLSAWGKVLHDEDLAAAILDRVLERGRFIHLQGPSGRTGHQLDGQEHLPTTADGARISGIDRPKFPEPTSLPSNSGSIPSDWCWAACCFAPSTRPRASSGCTTT